MFRVRARYNVQVPAKRTPAGLGAAKVIWGGLGLLLLAGLVVMLLPVLIVAGLLLVLLRSTSHNLTPLAEVFERLAAWLRRSPMPEPPAFLTPEAVQDAAHRALVESETSPVGESVLPTLEQTFGVRFDPRPYPH